MSPKYIKILILNRGNLSYSKLHSNLNENKLLRWNYQTIFHSKVSSRGQKEDTKELDQQCKNEGWITSTLMIKEVFNVKWKKLN